MASLSIPDNLGLTILEAPIQWKYQFVLLLILSLFLFSGCAGLNRYRTDGNLILKLLDAPVKVVQDEKGMAYVYADSLDDAMRALGYVDTQGRLFQMTLTRFFAEGRICELAGEKAKELDVRHRTLGLHRQAIKHAGMREPEARRFFQNYVDGINAYIQTGQDSFPLEFKLAELSPERWTIADSLALLYFMSWDTSANLKTEIVAQMLIEKLGRQTARAIFPLVVNPDDDVPPADAAFSYPVAPIDIQSDKLLLGFLEDGSHEMGSNNWAAGPAMSAGGKPVVCNDPHLETRILPGSWYPAGFFTPEYRIVGGHIPGLAPDAHFLQPVCGHRHCQCLRALAQANIIMLNVAFADTDGKIGWHVSGRLPIRSDEDGTVPFVVTDGRDNWRGFVP